MLVSPFAPTTLHPTSQHGIKKIQAATFSACVGTRACCQDPRTNHPTNPLSAPPPPPLFEKTIRPAFHNSEMICSLLALSISCKRHESRPGVKHASQGKQSNTRLTSPPLPPCSHFAYFLGAKSVNLSPRRFEACNVNGMTLPDAHSQCLFLCPSAPIWQVRSTTLTSVPSQFRLPTDSVDSYGNNGVGC